MRLTTVILIASLLQVSAAGFAQKITLNQRNTSLEAVLKEIRKQSGYDYYYDSKIVSKDQKVSVFVKDATIDQALKEVLNGLPVVYEIEGKTISIKKKESTFLERLADRWASIDVSGRVVDADGRGLPGASVSVKGKGGKAVSTGANGSFYLKGVDEDAVLVVSFIGYVTKEVKAVKELGDVVLELSTSKLDEVQVIAYGTTTQRLSTGNVTTIKADVIEKQPVNNPLLALQGRVPGLFIEQATGFAGTGVKVRIQGQNSLNYGSDPLYVIDGVPYSSQLLPNGNQILGTSGSTVGFTTGSPFSFINSAEIESIDVLKDADATAIYGSRAANGAILITTKKGSAGDTKIDLNLQSGWAKIGHKLDLMNTEQYLEMRREALKNDGKSSFSKGDFDLNGTWDNSRNIDWQKELIGGTASYNDVNATVSGGNDRTTFLIGAGYHRETNVFPGEYSDRKGSLHFNLNNSSKNQRFKIQLSGSYLDDNNRMPNVDLTLSAVSLVPVAPALYTATGRINWAPNASGGTTFNRNPIGYQYNEYKDLTKNLLGNMLLSYKFLQNLEFKSSFGYTNIASSSTNKRLLQSVIPEILQFSTRSTTFGDTKTNSWIIEPQINFNQNISEGKLEVLLGTSLQENKSTASQISAGGFSNDLVMDDILSATNIVPISSIYLKYNYLAFFGRVNYNWKNKYLLNLTARRDGSSRFGSENQLHSFSSIGAAWIFSEEKIIKDKLSFLSFGKLRGSFGTTGNDQIPDYQFLSLYEPVSQYNPYQGIPIYQPNRLTNPYLQWESTKKFQMGIDLGFLKDRIVINSNYYVNRSSNQLSGYDLPATTGFSTIIKNQVFKIENSGWEIMISTINLKSNKFSWSSGFNISIPKTLMMEYPGIEKSSANYSAIIGKPLGAMYVYHFLGVDPATGVYQFADKNGNPTSTPGFEDLNVIVSPFPKFYGGFQNSISYKGFQLDFLFSFVKQTAKNYAFGSSPIRPGQFNAGYGNQVASLLSRWQKPGDITSIQRFTTGSALATQLSNVYNSDAGFADASYLRLKNLAVSWQVPESWKDKLSLRNCSLFLQGQNLWTITNYTGLDPETKSSISLPPLRVMTIGVKVGL